MNSRNRAKHQKILESKTAKVSGCQAVFGICVCVLPVLCVFFLMRHWHFFLCQAVVAKSYHKVPIVLYLTASLTQI